MMDSVQIDRVESPWKGWRVTFDGERVFPCYDLMEVTALLMAYPEAHPVMLTREANLKRIMG
jgi:hypothetical protein